MSDINNKLLELYIARGATSKSLPMAEREALIAAGAADGKWTTYLAQQGYTGSYNEMLHTYLGDLGYTSPSLQDRWYAAVMDGAFLVTAHPLSFAELGISGTAGYLFDGTASSVWTDNDMTTLASSSGVSTGAVWEDLSGNGSHATRTVSANRPVWYESGGIQSLRGGFISGVARSFDVPALGDIASYTLYAVVRSYDIATTYGPILHIFSQNGGGFFYCSKEAGTGDSWYTVVPGSLNNFFGPAGDGPAGIIKIKYEGGIQFGRATSTMAGAFNTQYSASVETDINIVASQILGYVGGDSYESIESPFIFCAATSIMNGSDLDNTIVNYMRNTFGSW